MPIFYGRSAGWAFFRADALETADVRRLRELERENARLKKLVADQALDISILKEANRGNF